MDLDIDAKQALHEHLVRECLSYKVQAAIFHEAILSFSSTEYGKLINYAEPNNEPSFSNSVPSILVMVISHFR